MKTDITVPLFTHWEITPDKTSFEFKCEQGQKIARAAYNALLLELSVFLPSGQPGVFCEENRLVFNAEAKEQKYIDNFFNLYKAEITTETDKVKLDSFKIAVQGSQKPSLYKLYKELLPCNFKFSVQMEEKRSKKMLLPARIAALTPVSESDMKISTLENPVKKLLITPENLKEKIFELTADNYQEFCEAIISFEPVDVISSEKLEILQFLHEIFNKAENSTFKHSISAIAILFFAATDLIDDTMRDDFRNYIFTRIFVKDYVENSEKVLSNLREIFKRKNIDNSIKKYPRNFLEFLMSADFPEEEKTVGKRYYLPVPSQPEDFGACGAYAAFNNLISGTLISGDEGTFANLFDILPPAGTPHPREKFIEFFVRQAGELKQAGEDASPALMMELFSNNNHPFPDLIKATEDFNGVSADTFIPVKKTGEGDKLEIGKSDPIFQLKMIKNIINLFARRKEGKDINYSFLIYFDDEHWFSLTCLKYGDKTRWMIADSSPNYRQYQSDVCSLIETLLSDFDFLKQYVKEIIEQSRSEFLFLREDKPESIADSQVETLVELWLVLAADPLLRSLISRMDVEKVETLIKEWPALSNLSSKIDKIKFFRDDVEVLAAEALEFDDQKDSRSFYRAQFREITKKAAEKHGIGPAILKPLIKKTDSSEFKQQITEFFSTELYKEEKSVYDIEDKACIPQLNNLFGYLKQLCIDSGHDFTGIETVRDRLTQPGKYYPFSSKPSDQNIFYQNIKWQLEVILFSFYQLRKKLSEERYTHPQSLLAMRIVESNTTLAGFLGEFNDLPNTTELCPESYNFINDIFHRLNSVDGIDKELADHCKIRLLTFASDLAMRYYGEFSFDGVHLETNTMRAASECGLPVAALQYVDIFFSGPDEYKIEVDIRNWLATEFFKGFNRDTILSWIYGYFRDNFFREIARFSSLELNEENVNFLKLKMKPFIDNGLFILYGNPHDKNVLVWEKDGRLILNNTLKEDNIELSSKFFSHSYALAVSSQRILPLSLSSEADIDLLLKEENFYSLMGMLLSDQKAEINISKDYALNLLIEVHKYFNTIKDDKNLYEKNRLLFKIVIDFMNVKGYYLLPEQCLPILCNISLKFSSEQSLFNYVFDLMVFDPPVLKEESKYDKQQNRYWDLMVYERYVHLRPQSTTEIILNNSLFEMIEGLREISDLKLEDFDEQVVNFRKKLGNQISLEKFLNIISLRTPKEAAAEFLAAYARTSVDIDELLQINRYTTVDFNQRRCFDEKESKPTTPLLWALRTRRFDQFKKLLELEADPEISVGDDNCFMLAMNDWCELAVFNQLLGYLFPWVGGENQLFLSSQLKLIKDCVVTAAKRSREKLLALLSSVYLPEKILKLSSTELPSELLTIFALIGALRACEYELALSYFPRRFEVNLLPVIFSQCRHNQSQEFLKKLIDREENSQNACELLKFYQQNVESKAYEPVVFDLNTRRKGKPLLLLAMEEKNPQSRLEQVKIFLKNGARVSLADTQGNRPLDKALELPVLQQNLVLRALLESEIKPAADWFEAVSPQRKSLLVAAAESKKCHSDNFSLILDHFLKADIEESRRLQLLRKALAAAVLNGNNDRIDHLKQLIIEKQQQIKKIGDSLSVAFFSSRVSGGKVSDLKMDDAVSIDFPIDFKFNLEHKNIVFVFDDKRNGERMASEMGSYLKDSFPELSDMKDAIICKENQLIFSFSFCQMGYLEEFIRLFGAAPSCYQQSIPTFIKSIQTSIDKNFENLSLDFHFKYMTSEGFPQQAKITNKDIQKPLSSVVTFKA